MRAFLRLALAVAALWSLVLVDLLVRAGLRPDTRVGRWLDRLSWRVTRWAERQRAERIQREVLDPHQRLLLGASRGEEWAIYALIQQAREGGPAHAGRWVDEMTRRGDPNGRAYCGDSTSQIVREGRDFVVRTLTCYGQMGHPGPHWHRVLPEGQQKPDWRMRPWPTRPPPWEESLHLYVDPEDET